MQSAAEVTSSLLPEGTEKKSESKILCAMQSYFVEADSSTCLRYKIRFKFWESIKLKISILTYITVLPSLCPEGLCFNPDGKGMH